MATSPKPPATITSAFQCGCGCRDGDGCGRRAEAVDSSAPTCRRGTPRGSRRRRATFMPCSASHRASLISLPLRTATPCGPSRRFLDHGPPHLVGPVAAVPRRLPTAVHGRDETASLRCFTFSDPNSTGRRSHLTRPSLAPAIPRSRASAPDERGVALALIPPPEANGAEDRNP